LWEGALVCANVICAACCCEVVLCVWMWCWDVVVVVGSSVVYVDVVWRLKDVVVIESSVVYVDVDNTGSLTH